jgi:CTP synthase (UTP-ammonia lyase)
MPKQVDVYTGEYQIMYKAQFITELVNKLTPFDVSPLNLSEYEQAALDLGIHKTMLNGRYNVGDKEVVLKAGDVQKLNQYYGELNKKDLDALLNNQLRIKVKNEKGTYSKLLYSQMTEKQKKAAFTQIMGKNSQYAQVYILTSKGYKYYASESEYIELRKLGVTKNVYRKTNKLSGFVEP